MDKVKNLGALYYASRSSQSQTKQNAKDKEIIGYKDRQRNIWLSTCIYTGKNRKAQKMNQKLSK